MAGWNDVESAVNSATNSLGSADAENQRFMSSIQGKVNQFNSEFQKLSANFIDSNLIKIIVDIGKGLLSLTNTLGVFNVAILTTVTILAVSGKFGAGIIGISSLIDKLVVSLGMGTAAATTFSAALSVIIPVAVLLAGIAVVNQISKANERLIETQQKIIDQSNENIQNNQKEIDSLTSLQVSLRNSKGNKESLLAIQQSLNDAVGFTPGLLDGEAKAYDIANQKIRDRIELLNSEIKIEKDRIIAANREIFNAKTSPYKSGIDDLSAVGLSVSIEDAYKQLERYQKLADRITEIGGDPKYYNDKIARYKSFLQEMADTAKNYFADYINQSLSDTSSRATVNGLIEELLLGGEDDLTVINQKIDAIIPSLQKINDLKNDLAKAKVEGTSTDTVVGEYLKVVDELKTAMPEQTQFFDDMGSSFAQMAKSPAPLTEEIVNYTSVLEDASKATDDFLKGVKTLNSAFGEQKENGRLSAETIMAITEAGYYSALQIDKETGVVKLNAEAYKELAKAKLEAQLAGLRTTAADLSFKITDQINMRNIRLPESMFPDLAENQKQLETLNAQIAAYEDIARNFDSITSGIYGEKTKVSKEDPYKDSVESKIDDLRYLHDMGKVSEAEYLNELDALNNKYYKNLAKYKEESRRLDVEVYKGRNQLADQAARDEEKRADDAKKRQEENIKKDQDAIDHRIQYYTDAYEKHKDENKLVADLESILKFVNISEEQRLEIIKKIAEIRKNEYSEVLSDYENENFLLEKKAGTEQKRIDNYRKMQETVHAEAEKLRSQGFSESSDEIQSLIRLWWEYEDNIEGILTGLNDKITQSLKNSLDEQAKLIQSQIDDLTQEQSDLQNALNYVLSTIDSQISALENEKKLLQENNDESERAITLAKLQDALINARNNKNVRVYDSTQGWIWTNDAFKETEAQSAIDEFNKAESLRKEIAGIDARIDAWNNYKSQWQKISSDYELSQNSLIAKQMLGASIESQVLAQRTSAVETFGQKYLATIEAIKIAQSELNDIQSQISNVESGGSFTGGSGKIAPIAYDSTRDYQAEINAILLKMQNATPEEKKQSSYANYMERLRSLETQRNSKIKQERLPYEQTSLYGGQTFANGSDSVPQTGVSLVGENGAEYRIINKGDGILSANVTRTLKSFGSNPLQFITSRIPQISSLINNKTTSSQTHYHFGDVVLPNANDFPSFVSGLQLYVDTHKA